MCSRIDSLPIQIRGRGRGSHRADPANKPRRIGAGQRSLAYINEQPKIVTCEASWCTKSRWETCVVDDYPTKFRKIVDRLADKVRTAKVTKIPPILYHYTDAAGLIGMLSNHSIWLTDYRFLNDKSEVEHTRTIGRKVILDKLKLCSDPVCVKLYRAILKYQEIESTADEFLFSMSGQPDDLSQWRGYAREGQGFTVGLSGPAIAESTTNAWFAQVVYKDDMKTRSLMGALAALERELVVQIGATPDNSEDIIDQAAIKFDYFLENCAVFNKHNSFRAEDEWRVVANIKPTDVVGRVKVRASGNRMVRYIELKLGDKLPITEIGIGPGFLGSEEIYAVESLCRLNGYRPRIYNADTPYRRM